MYSHSSPVLPLPGAAAVALLLHAGIWQGTVIALKVLVLPPQLTRNERRRQMALMEAAISSAMSHPNIVQVPSAVLCCAGVCAGQRVGERGGTCAHCARGVAAGVLPALTDRM